MYFFYSTRCATLAVFLLRHVALDPVVTHSECHQYSQLGCSPSGFPLVGFLVFFFFLSLQFISLHSLLSNKVIQILFCDLHGTLVDAIHQSVLFLMYGVISSGKADAVFLVS